MCPDSSEQVVLSGGPYDGVEVPRPAWRWDRINIVEDDDKTSHAYRPKRDGSYVYDGEHQILFWVRDSSVGAA
jgi:hypothetical protein